MDTRPSPHSLLLLLWPRHSICTRPHSRGMIEEKLIILSPLLQAGRVLRAFEMAGRRPGRTVMFVACTAAVGLPAAAAVAARGGQLEEPAKAQQASRRLMPRPEDDAVVRQGGRARNLETSTSLSTSVTSDGIAISQQHENTQHPTEHETGRAGWRAEGGHDERPVVVGEPPSIAHILERNVDRCRWDATEIAGAGASCGPPLSEPCFDRSRCQAAGGPKIYVFDQEVCGSVGGGVQHTLTRVS